MYDVKRFSKFILFTTFLFCILSLKSEGQMITGVWKGRIDKKKVELKIIQNGDSLTGTSYYYESENNYRRYSIKGYFDVRNNQAIWWDDQLIGEKSGKYSLSTPGKTPYLSSTDFNCPGSNKMFLDGKAAYNDYRTTPRGEVHLEKQESSLFTDDWDFVIDNYTSGANDPYIIDSIAGLAFVNTDYIKNEPVEKLLVIEPPAKKEEKKSIASSQPEMVKSIPPVSSEEQINQKFVKREKIFTMEIPLAGDSIELRFYDNAEIDGDSISLFLNNKMIFEHIKLAAAPYVIKLSVAELNEVNELVMVAENLGSIPPNTSYMVAICGNKRYDANLASTEQSSAAIRLVKPKTGLSKADQ